MPPFATFAAEGPALTVYSSADPAGFNPQQFVAQQRTGRNPNFVWQVPGFGVVKEIREMVLENGTNALRFTDVAQFIDPTTVSFTDLTDRDGTSVLEQSFEFDLVSPSKLLEKYVGQSIAVIVSRGQESERISGKLLSFNEGQLVLDTPKGVRIARSSNELELGDLPEGLITKPTLRWLVKAAKEGTHKVRTTYQTGGMTWRADYNLVVNQEDTAADLGAWVSLMNLSGASFQNARLKLIAGDVQRVTPQPRRVAYRRELAAMAVSEDAGFQEKSFFEYHLYTLPRRTDILNNSTQQLVLFPTARNIGIEKVLLYYGLPQSANWGFTPSPRTDRGLGATSSKKIDVYLRFQNSEENGLGVPLPAGKVRAYKQDDADGTLEFVGEDVIDHTAKNEKVLIKLGQAFDVVGERTQTNYSMNSAGKTLTESFRIEIRNQKEIEQKVIVKENLFRWTSWEIINKSQDFEKIDARTIHFEVVVPASGSQTVTYTVRYSW